MFNGKFSNLGDLNEDYIARAENLNWQQANSLLKEYLYIYNLDGGIIENILTEQELNNENKVIPEAIDAYKLYQFILGPKESREFNLLLFMNPDTPAIEEVMNANWKSKITVTSSYMSNETAEIEKNTILPRYIVTPVSNDISTYGSSNGDLYPFFYNAKRITFQNTITPIEGVDPIDISQNQTGTVLAYVVEEQDESVTRDSFIPVTVIIQAEGTIYLPEDSYGLFADSYNLQSIEGLENVNTKNVTNMSGMFAECQNLASLDLSNFNTEKAINMNSMFSNCRSLTTLDLSNFNTSNVTDMWSMFSKCSSLTSLDLSNFDTSNVESMSWMFEECSSLTNLNLNGWILKDGNDYNSMFCHVLEDIVNNSGLQNNLTENKDIMFKCNYSA